MGIDLVFPFHRFLQIDPLTCDRHLASVVARCGSDSSQQWRTFKFYPSSLPPLERQQPTRLLVEG